MPRHVMACDSRQGVLHPYHSMQALGGLASRFIIVILAELGNRSEHPTFPSA